MAEVWAAEFGSYEPVPIGRDQVADSLRIVFEAGVDDLDGFFPFDPPGGFGVSRREPDLKAAIRDGFANVADWVGRISSRRGIYRPTGLAESSGFYSS